MINMINISPVLSIFSQNVLKTGEMLIMLIFFFLWGPRGGGGSGTPPPPPPTQGSQKD